MRYIDSSAFVYAAVYEGAKADKARELINHTVHSGDALTSSLTIDELTWVVWRITKNKDVAVKEAKRLFRFHGLEIVPVEATDAYDSLGLLGKQEQMRPRDAIHLTIAKRYGCKEIISDDSDFDDRDGIERISLE